MDRFVKALVTLATGALLTLGLTPGALAATGPAPDVGRPAVAAAAVAKGYCNPGDTGSVTVVVDFSGVGGGIDIRCSSGSTGQQALANAFSYSEVASQPGFVCQIEGAPAGDCQNTSPGSAYWSYWQAAPGGSWNYSNYGFSSSRVKPGGFEGWSFGSGGAPGVDPVLPAAPEPEPPAQEPEQPAPQPEAPAAPQPEQPAAEQPAAEQPAAEFAPDDGAANNPANDSATASSPEGAAGSDPDAEAAAAAAAAVAAQAESVAQAAAAAAATAAAQAAEAAAASAASASAVSATGNSAVATSAGGSADLSASESTSGSTIWFSLVALLAVASLGTAAVVMSHRRRSGAGDDQAG